METLLQLLLILFFAKVFGEILERIGLPSILGEISAGIVLGILLISPDTEVLKFFAELGAIFLLFTAGYQEVHFDELKTASRRALIPTIVQMFTAFSFGFILGWLFNLGFLESLFMGVAFSPTSIGVVVKTLIDFEYLTSKPGSVMLASAVLDDIIGVFLLAILVTTATYEQLPLTTQILTITAKLVIFIVLMGLLGFKVYPKLFTYIQRMHVKEAIFTSVVIIALLSAYLSELFGLHSVIGAFIGGVLLSNIPFAKIKDVERKISGLSYGLLVPIFFAYIGLSTNIGAVRTAGIFTILVIIMALTGKLIGGFAGSKLIGFNNHDSLIFGIGMMPRAGVELVVISVGKTLGLVGDETFSAIVLMVTASIIISPILLKLTIKPIERTQTETT